MAGSLGANDLCGNWWGEWIQAAKDKSAAALEMVRKDLAEFGCTMQKDTSHAVEVTSSTLKESMKAENRSGTKEKLSHGLNTFLEGVSRAIAVPPDDEGQIPITASSVDPYDRAKVRLHAIQVDPETYLSEPEGPREEYSRWCESFDMENAKGEISDLLVSKAEVRALYTKLVPSRVSHMEFWRHYFYRRHRLDVDQARKEALMRRAERSRTDSTLSWDDDWSGDEGAEEDSGSDWEKLPRPHQTTQSDASSERPVAQASAATPNTPPSGQQTGFHSNNQAGAEPSSTLLSSANSPSADLQGDASPEPVQAAAAATTAEVPALTGEAARSEESPGTFVNLHPQAEDSVPVPTDRVMVRDLVEAVCSDQSSRVEDCGQSKPMSEGVEPMSSPVEHSSLLEPVSRRAEAVSSQMQPVSNHAEPVSNEAKLLSSQAEPASRQGEPLKSKVEPLSREVEPVSCEMEPVSSPVSSQAGSPGSPMEEERNDMEPNLTQDGPAVTRQTQAAPETSTPSVTSHSKETEPSGGQTEQSILAGGEGCEAGNGEGSVLKAADHKKASTDDGDPATAAPASAIGAAACAPEEEDWDQDLDVELTEEDMKAAEELAKTLGHSVDLEEDDWENWE